MSKIRIQSMSKIRTHSDSRLKFAPFGACCFSLLEAMGRSVHPSPLEDSLNGWSLPPGLWLLSLSAMLQSQRVAIVRALESSPPAEEATFRWRGLSSPQVVSGSLL